MNIVLLNCQKLILFSTIFFIVDSSDYKYNIRKLQRTIDDLRRYIFNLQTGKYNQGLWL